MVRLICFLIVAATIGARPLSAQDGSSGADAIAALEKAVIATIAKTEGSVVAIARVRTDGRDPAADRFDLRPGPFPSPFSNSSHDPTTPEFTPQEYATGVVIEGDGLIVTTRSFLGEISKNDYYVWSQRRPYKATVRAADSWLDLAVLQVEAPDLEPLKLGDAKTLRKGQFVIALGNPHAIAKNGEMSARWGVVANLDRQASMPRPDARRAETVYHYGGLIEVDARWERGVSGGALVNLDGELVGLITTYAPHPDASVTGGLAIPVDDAFKGALAKLKNGREAEYGFLGVGPSTSPLGVEIGSVSGHTPADKAGLWSAHPKVVDRPADIITHVDDIKVADAHHLMLLIGKRPAQSTVRLTILRYDPKREERRAIQTSIMLAKKGIETSRPSYASVIDPPWRGLTVEHVTALPGFNPPSTLSIDIEGCVGVLEVVRDSVAWKAGLRPGACISHVDGQRVKSPDQFRKLTEGKQGQVQLRLTEVIGNSSTVKVPAP